MTLSDLLANTQTILPLAILTLWACALLIADLFIPQQRKGLTALLAAAGLIVSFVFLLPKIAAVEPQYAFGRMIAMDGFAAFLQALFLGSGLVGIAISFDYIRRRGIERGEYYILMLFSVGGMMLMSMAADLIVVFLALEWLSIPLYILSGFARPRSDSEESALKYFLLGAYAGGFVLYGTALVYGATGSTALAKIVQALAAGQANLALLTVGAGLILVGFGFKVSAVPFHMWTPDVYEGAPTSVTAFMAVGAKAGGFAALLRIFVSAFPDIVGNLFIPLWILAALTMILGNVLAIAQSNIKRLLAYSSIAHAGYILMALVSFGFKNTADGTPLAASSVAASLLYLLAYALTSFGAWAVVMALEQAEEAGTATVAVSKPLSGLALQDFAGLGRKYPALAAAMAVFMLSFTGVPPTLGFVGKFYLFSVAIQGGQIALALIGVITSLISAYYYLRLLVIMYMQPGDPKVHSETWLNLTAVGSALAVVALSIFATPLFNWAARALLAGF